jgi:hypothetical protein
MQKIGLLIELGIVKKTRSAINIYSLNQDYSSEAMMLVAGYFGFLEKRTGK